jgi:hypothetical protein
MQYFSTLPKIVYNNPITGNPLVMTDLMARSSIVSSLFSNPLLFYQYDVQDGDTPEIVAFKYYGDAYRYWIVLFSNNYLDPQWNWPLDSTQFGAYIADKYQTFDPTAVVYQYQKITTQYNAGTLTTTTNTMAITQSEYNSLPASSSNLYTLPGGAVTITVTTNALTYYEWELQQNEAKRSINLINSNYVDEFERQFKKLMAS